MDLPPIRGYCRMGGCRLGSPLIQRLSVPIPTARIRLPFMGSAPRLRTHPLLLRSHLLLLPLARSGRTAQPMPPRRLVSSLSVRDNVRYLFEVGWSRYQCAALPATAGRRRLRERLTDPHRTNRQPDPRRGLGVLPAATAAGVSGAAAAVREHRHLAPEYCSRHLHLCADGHLPAAARGCTGHRAALLAHRRGMGQPCCSLSAVRSSPISRASLQACGAVFVALSRAASLGSRC